MASILEQKLSSSIRSALADLPNTANIPDSEPFREALTGLKFFIPVVLAEIHPEWRFGGLDDVLPVEARKTREGEVEIFGLCCFVSDQTLTPIHLHLQISESGDEISWLECRFGERKQHDMLREPYYCLRQMTKRLRTLKGQTDLIDWVYKVTFGKRRF